MSFANFTNPYRSPADVPEDYRKHPNLSKLFKADGTYVRPAEDEVSTEVIRRREAKQLRSQAEAVVTAAKARVERMILGEEVDDG